MNYIIHIGLNKTGTTSIQSYLYEARKNLAKQGICYPDIGIDINAHHNISRVIKGQEVKGISDNWPKLLESESANCHTTILSSEDFRTIKQPAWMKKYFPKNKTKIILYIREHFSFISSWYQQDIHSRNTAYSLEEFYQIHSANFMDIIEEWSSVYGEENIIVREYNRNTLKNGDVIADFLDVTCGIDKDNSIKLDKRNPSIAGALLEFKRALNLQISFEESQKITGELVNLAHLKPSFIGGCHATDELVRKIRWVYREDRKAVRQRFGFKFDEDRKRPASLTHAQMQEEWQFIIEQAKHKKLSLVELLKRMPKV